MTTTTAIVHNQNQDKDKVKKLTEVSPEMRKLLKKLKDEIVSFRKSIGQIVKEIAEQGKHDNLSKSQIRAHIDFTVGDSLSERQLQRILPLELKYTEKIRTKTKKEKEEQKSADMMYANQIQNQRCEITGCHNNSVGDSSGTYYCKEHLEPMREKHARARKITSEVVGKFLQGEMEAQQQQQESRAKE